MLIEYVPFELRLDNVRTTLAARESIAGCFCTRNIDSRGEIICDSDWCRLYSSTTPSLVGEAAVLGLLRDVVVCSEPLFELDFSSSETLVGENDFDVRKLAVLPLACFGAFETSFPMINDV